MRRLARILLIATTTAIAVAMVAVVAARLQRPGRSQGDVPHKVYVALGFHANFYHSWRGDTPDEAGFGTDIRVVRAILRMLDEANARGLDARGYWESESHFTLETIIPAHAPDIIDGIRRRVAAGLDEVLIAPYDNGLFHAMTEEEMRASIRWAIRNPWDSGVADLFDRWVPVLRPQEYMFTTGSIPILESEGIRAVILGYSSYPFTAFSNFVEPLPPVERYNPLWLRTRPNGPRTIVLPAVSLGDVINFGSLESWLLDLRTLQTEGVVGNDLLLHINFDADAETWLPIDMPPGLGWMPNTGGLPEYIEAVNRYEWAEFINPGEYLETHSPVGEVLVRQDMADGAWDGNYSWAEKAASHDIWTRIEQSRLFARRARALMPEAPPALRRRAETRLVEGRNSSFFERLRALSTTHFGMSTPLVNEEREAVAMEIAGTARRRALQAERVLAAALVQRPDPEMEAGVLYRLALRRLPDDELTGERLVRVPVVLPEPVPRLRIADEYGRAIPAAVVDVEPIGSGQAAARLCVLVDPANGPRRITVRAQPENRDTDRRSAGERAPDEWYLANPAIGLRLDERHGIAELTHAGEVVGDRKFFDPFVTYRVDDRPTRFGVSEYRIHDLAGEQQGPFRRARLTARIPIDTGTERMPVIVEVRFTVPPRAAHVVADVRVDYPRTPTRDILHTVQQKLRRYLDLRWIEVAPFALHPRLAGRRERPLRVWKHNHLGVTSHYDLDYARINEANAEIDAFNHQVTAGWVAVSDRTRGLLIAQNADERASFAFAPMRLRERAGRQRLWINPFGSFHGEQMDYGHLGGNGLGTALTVAAGAQFHPNAPGYNGRTERFSLLLVPYRGDAPPARLQAEAQAFFHPPSVVYEQTPRGIHARLPEDLRRSVRERRTRMTAARLDGPLAPPGALLANPTGGAVDLVWDEPADPRVEGYELAWRLATGEEWTVERIGRTRRHRIDSLKNGRRYAFRLRAVGRTVASPWAGPVDTTVGPVPPPPMTSEAGNIGPTLLLRVFWAALRTALRTL